MAIAIVNTPSTNTITQTGTGSSMTIPSVTIGAGQTLVVATAMRDGGASITGVTWNGSENLTKSKQSVLYLYSAIFTLHNPTATTADIVITFSASRDRPKIGTAYVLSGTDTTSGFIEATGSANSAGSTSITQSITTVTDGAMVIDSIVQQSDAINPTITVDGSQTQTINQEVQGTYGGRTGQSYKAVSTAGATSMSWTSSNSLQWEATSIAIKPAVGSATTFIPRGSFIM